MAYNNRKTYYKNKRLSSQSLNTFITCLIVKIMQLFKWTEKMKQPQQYKDDTCYSKWSYDKKSIGLTLPILNVTGVQKNNHQSQIANRKFYLLDMYIQNTAYFVFHFSYKLWWKITVTWSNRATLIATKEVRRRKQYARILHPCMYVYYDWNRFPIF